MFDRYLDEIKGQPFVIAFVLLSILGCVAYSYHFQPMYTPDDEVMIYGPNIEVFSSDWGYWLKRDPRMFGWIMATLFSDGTNGKNLALFANLLGCSFFSLFFVRFGLAVKSIFWLVLLSAPLFINTMMNAQMNYVICIIRFIPVVFLISLALPVLIENKLKNIVLVGLTLFLTIWTFQLSLVYYIAGVIMLCFVDVIQNQSSDLKTILTGVVKHKIIPAILSMLIGVALYWIVHKLTLNVGGLLVEQTTQYSFNFVSLSAVLMRLKQTIYYMIYNIYPATVHNGHLIFMILLISAIGSVFCIFKNQPLKQQLTLSGLLIVSLFLMLIIINAGMELTTIPIVTRFISYDITFVVLCMYLIQLGLQHVKSWRKISAFLLFIFVLQMGNQVAYHGYKQIIMNTAKRSMLNRLVGDLINFMRKNNINKAMPVHILGFNSGYWFGGIKTKPKLQYLHIDQANAIYSGQMTRFFPQYLTVLGATNAIKGLDHNKVNEQRLIEICQQIQNDKTMRAWPFSNSMKLIDGAIYVRVNDYGADFCQGFVYWTKFDRTISPNRIKLRDGYYDLSK